MKDGLTIEVTIDLMAYCIDFDLQSDSLLNELHIIYSEKVRQGITDSSFNDWVNVKLMMMRSDKES